MATVIICDKCKTDDKVWHGETCDLCHPCAMEVIDACPTCGQIAIGGEVGEGERGVRLVDAKPSPVPSPVLSKEEIEEKILQQRARLFVEHGVEVHGVTPDGDVEAGQRIKYGADLRVVQVIEPVFGTGGVKWFAKIVK